MKNLNHTSIHTIALSASPPQWIELLPEGQKIKGRDGRHWHKKEPQAILHAFLHHAARPGRIPIDLEHSTELLAPQGQPAPAVGWITELEEREQGSIWGKAEWNKQGQELLTSQSYKFLSPVILHDQNGAIHGINSVGLTNDPNLKLTALNRATLEEGNAMKPIIQALKLKDGASESDMLQAIEALKKSNQDLNNQLQTALNQADGRPAERRPTQSPSLAEFVPRADYDKALNRASEAEKHLNEQTAKQQEEAIDALIAQGLQEGKIAPASVDYHKAACRAEKGMEQFEAFLKNAPAVITEIEIPQGKPEGEQKALNQSQKQIFSMLGIEAKKENAPTKDTKKGD